MPSQLLKHAGNDLAHKLNQCLTELSELLFYEGESPFVIKKRLMGEILQYKQMSIDVLNDLDSVMQAFSVCPRSDYPTIFLSTGIHCYSRKKFFNIAAYKDMAEVDNEGEST